MDHAERKTQTGKRRTTGCLWQPGVVMRGLDYGIVTTDPKGVAPLVLPAPTGTANSLEGEGNTRRIRAKGSGVRIALTYGSTRGQEAWNSGTTPRMNTAALIKRLRATWSGQSCHELQALRHALDAAAEVAETALTTAGAHAEPDGPIGAPVERLTATADARAEAAAHQALTDARATIEALQRDLQAGATEQARLVTALDDLREQAKALQSALDTEQDQAAAARAELANANHARALADAARQTVEASWHDATREHDAVRRQVDELRCQADVARAEFVRVTTQFETEATERATLAEALSTAHTQLQTADMQHCRLTEQVDAAAARIHALELAQADQEHVRCHLQGMVDAAAATEALLRERASEAEHAMEQLRAEVQLARQAAAEAQAGFDETSALRARVQTQLDAERAANASLLETVEEARQRIEVIQAAAHAEIQAVQAEREALEGANRTLEADAQSRALAGQHHADADRAPLDRVRRALEAIEAVTTVRDILETLVVQLAREFARVALFMVRHNRLEGWCGRGFNPTIDIENIVVPLTIASPLTRAFTDRTPATLAAGADGITVGLFGGAVAWAMALPVLAQECVVAVVYAEHPEELPAGTAAVGQQIAEILTDYVSRCIGAKRLAEAGLQRGEGQEKLGEAGAAPVDEASPPYPGPAREARRVKVGEGLMSRSWWTTWRGSWSTCRVSERRFSRRA